MFTTSVTDIVEPEKKKNPALFPEPVFPAEKANKDLIISLNQRL